MHNVYEGYFQYLLQLWNSSTNVNLFKIDEQWKEQILPYFTHKVPRSIIHNLNQLKAFEIFIIFHFYHPLFKKHMPEKHYRHVSKLVRVLNQLSQPIWRKQTLKLDEELLSIVKEHEELYGKDYCTLNVHFLSHLSYCVRLHGPLPFFSAFPFESFNKVLTDGFLSINSIPHCICLFQSKQVLSEKNMLGPKKAIWINNFEYLLLKNHSMIYDTNSGEVGWLIQEENEWIEIQYISKRKEKHRKKEKELLPCAIIKTEENEYLYYPVLKLSYYYF